jgi:hypothetical protein
MILKILEKKLSNRSNIPVEIWTKHLPNTSIEHYCSVYLRNKPIPDLLHMVFTWYCHASGLHQAVIRLWCGQMAAQVVTWLPKCIMSLNTNFWGKLSLKFGNWRQFKRDAEKITFWNLTLETKITQMGLCGDSTTLCRVRKLQYCLIGGDRTFQFSGYIASLNTLIMYLHT